MASKLARALRLTKKPEHVGLVHKNVMRQRQQLCSPALLAKSRSRHPQLQRRRFVNDTRQYATMTPSQAIVAFEPGPGHKGGANWQMTDIKVPSELGDGELLIEMVASGICHTDIALTDPNKGQTFPMVAGHEGGR